MKILQQKMKILPLKNDDFGATRCKLWNSTTYSHVKTLGALSFTISFTISFTRFSFH